MEHYTLAIDIGGSKLMVGLVDSKGQITVKKKVLLNTAMNEGQIIQMVEDFSYTIMDENKDKKIDCTGVTIPGLADSQQGIWVYSCFSGIKDFPIQEVLMRKLKMPVYIANDVNACALGEKVYGSCQDIDDFIWITISNGIGGGLVLKGDLYEGTFFNAGEIGHMNVIENGDLCKCGNKGCLEAYASGASIARRYSERKGMDISLVKNGTINGEFVAKEARKGDITAQDIYKEAGYCLGKAIAAAANLINPQKVVLGGGVSLSMELFLPALQDTMMQMIFKEANRHLVIERTALDYDAALLGAAAIARRGIKTNSDIYKMI